MALQSSRTHRAMAALGLTTVLTAGCGSAVEAVDAREAPGRSQTIPTATTRHTTSVSAQSTDLEEDQMKIVITLGERRFGAVLTDSAASRDLLRQLPVTVDMIDHGGVEKTGALPSPLSLDGQPDGADPDVGDVGYYAPGNDLVLYYGDQSYYPGIVVLGRLDEGAAAQIADQRGPVTATVEAR
ncbi:cyclophilin-like fold protein [Terrabacter sp. Soil810]|uniref:cyclophilin-like fold protein n=1 Tax=Terrabacter sp. Soil810 TaxID=1736418 RepID=UPI001EED514C|nr:cyclophilin-like fold protein [Terrabacter sp. Soil810]